MTMVLTALSGWVPALSLLAGSEAAPDCEVCPLPFGQPVSTASATALEFHHAAATLRTDQVNDRGDYARITFPWNRIDSFQS